MWTQAVLLGSNNAGVFQNCASGLHNSTCGYLRCPQLHLCHQQGWPLPCRVVPWDSVLCCYFTCRDLRPCHAMNSYAVPCGSALCHKFLSHALIRLCAMPLIPMPCRSLIVRVICCKYVARLRLPSDPQDPRGSGSGPMATTSNRRFTRDHPLRHPCRFP